MSETKVSKREETTEVAKAKSGGLALPSSNADEKEFEKLAGEGKYLQRMQLYTGRSKLCGTGAIGVNEWGLPQRGGEEVTSLGKTCDFIVLARRGKAMDMSDLDEIISNYDMQSDEFKRIQKESEGQDSGCSYGPEFLLWSPKSGLVTYYANSATSRGESKKLFGFLPTDGQGVDSLTPVTFGSRSIKGKKYTWQGPTFHKCSTPVDLSTLDEDNLMEEIVKFLNPTSNARSEGVSAEEATAVSSRER